MDADELIQCPYDENHLVRHSRFPYHLVKCRENHKEKARQLATCPFNARHRVPKWELKIHLESCTDKKIEDLTEGFQCKLSEPQAVSANAWKCSSSGEDWEEEYDDFVQVTPFVFGTSTPERKFLQVAEDQNKGMSTSSWQPAVVCEKKESYHPAKVAPVVSDNGSNPSGCSKLSDCGNETQTVGSSSVAEKLEDVEKRNINPHQWQVVEPRGRKGRNKRSTAKIIIGLPPTAGK